MKKKSPSPSQTQEQLIALCRSALAQGVDIDSVLHKIDQMATRQAVTAEVEEQEVQAVKSQWYRRLPSVVRYGAFLLPILLLTAGFYLVGSAVIPILGYYVNDPGTDEQVSPIPQSQVMEMTPLFVVESGPGAKSEAVPTPKVVAIQPDYTNLSNWFTAATTPEFSTIEDETAIQEYTLSIPALNIENAVVSVGGTDLNKSLIAYPNTALPGDHGAPVIFGHSVLRQFYNPSVKNPRRYTSIFSTIMTLKPGKDKIYVTADGVTYTYLVQQKTEVKPEDVYILTQQYDAKRLKLVTCTPEGTYLRRGVVTAQLIADE